MEDCPAYSLGGKATSDCAVEEGHAAEATSSLMAVACILHAQHLLPVSTA